VRDEAEKIEREIQKKLDETPEEVKIVHTIDRYYKIVYGKTPGPDQTEAIEKKKALEHKMVDLIFSGGGSKDKQKSQVEIDIEKIRKEERAVMRDIKINLKKAFKLTAEGQREASRELMDKVFKLYKDKKDVVQ
jgi:hypothetical protein